MDTHGDEGARVELIGCGGGDGEMMKGPAVEGVREIFCLIPSLRCIAFLVCMYGIPFVCDYRKTRIISAASV
jgi:hypothetical protein